MVVFSLFAAEFADIGNAEGNNGQGRIDLKRGEGSVSECWTDVGEAGEAAGFGEDDRGGDNGAEERAAADFVEAGNAQKASAAGGFFEGIAATGRHGDSISTAGMRDS